MKRFDLSLYLILDAKLCATSDMVETARKAVAGGVSMVQLRDKHGDTAQRIATGLELKAILNSQVPLIINDDIEAALAIGADGVHLGQGDMKPEQARRLIGSDMILGTSVGTYAEAKAVAPEFTDYVGSGPVFATATKPDHKAPIGIEGLALLVAACKVPAVAIGGLKPGDVDQVMKTGVAGIAVASAICSDKDPEFAAVRLAEAIAKVKP